MKESEESPAYEAKHHSKKFLKEAESMAKEHMGGKHHDGHEEKKEHKKAKKMHEHKHGARKHAGK